MTQEEKDILIEKMLDPDGILSDAELEMIFLDDELKDFYEVSSAVRSACVQPMKINVEQEWRLFRHKIYPTPSRWRWAMRVAAIFLGVLFVTGVASIVLDRIFTDDVPAVVAESKPTAPVASIEPVVDREPKPIDKREKVASAESTEKVATPRKKAIRPSVPVLTEEEENEVDEYLRLQQSRIDNELAMMQAELYISELQALSDPDPSSSTMSSEAPTGSERRIVEMP